MGEERQVGGEVEQRHRLQLPAVGVDDVADGLEDEERHADGQDHVDQRERPVPDPVDPADDPLGVLEPDEHRQVGGDRGQHDHPPQPTAGRQIAVRGLVADRQRGEEQAITPVVDVEAPPGVEGVAGDEEEHLPARRERPQQPGHHEHDREEQAELEGGEDHSGAESRGRRRLGRGPHITLGGTAGLPCGHPCPGVPRP